MKKILLAVSIISLLLSGSAGAQNTYDWPCFHGADRSNKSPETGLLKSWLSDGPALLFTIQGLGEGYSSVSIGGGLIYTAGKSDNQTYVFAFDMNGKTVWKMPNGKAWSTNLSWAVSYTGARSTPTYSNGFVYHLSEGGRLTAYEATTGKELWSRDIANDFEAVVPEYGYSESVLVDGEKLFVRPSGKKGYQVCLNKKTGATLWATTGIPGTEGYSSFIIKEYGGYRQIIGSSSNCYYGVDTKSGKLLWKVDFANQRELNVADAISYNEYVFISSGYGKGSMLFKLKPSANGLAPETIWQTELMDNHHGGVILYNGCLYGSGTNSRGWYCLDFLTGKQMWKTDGKGSVTFADGMLYMLEERGIMKLVKAASDRYEKISEFKVPSGGEGMYWAHPVVCGGRLYIRHWDKIFVYDIKPR